LKKGAEVRMSQILIMYHSRTGNTKRLAAAIAEGVRQVEGVKAVLKPAPEVTEEDFLSSAGIIAGSPTYFGVMAAELKAAFDKFVGIRSQMEGKVGAAFATSAHHTGGKETTIMSIIEVLLIYGMIVIGDPMAASGHYGVACAGGVDEQTEKDGALLGKRVAHLVKRLEVSE
jgi:NAD(P)H dehydrogenase (quinone)